MKRNWIDLGEVLSGRDLAEGERVTLNVFDKGLNTLLEQISFRPRREQTGQRVWVADFCRHINTHSALVRAGTESDSGEWQVLESSYQNHFWGICSRALRVVATLPRQINWSSERVALHSEKTLSSSNTSIRVNVRSATGERLETITFTPSAKRLSPGLWTKDLAVQINNTSLFVRAGRENGDRIEPYWEGKSNYVWIPKGSGITVTWNFNGPREAGRIPSDRDAVDQERISLLAFDNVADKPLDRITLTARAEKKRLKKDQWPADLATQINASSSHAKAAQGTPDYLIHERYSELRTFTTALHLDNWVQADTLQARSDLRAAQRIVVNVTTAAKGNFCEALTFTPDPARLSAAKWAHDLAVHINQHSNYLKAGVKNTASKHITPQENSTGNLIWMPRDCGLKVSWEQTELKELGYISVERELKVNEACKAFVLDDTTEEILREITFSAAQGRNGKYQAGKDLAARINSQTQLVAAGQRSGDGQPAPASSTYLNTLWGCARNVRAFTTLMSLKNWEKGERIGPRDLREDEQVVLIVRGGKTGRIFESLLFTPTPGRFTKTLWPKDFSSLINARSRFVRGGEENTTLSLMEPMHKVDVNFFWTPKGSGLVVECQIISGIPYDMPGMSSEAREVFEQCAESRRHISVDVKTGHATLKIPLVELFADDSLREPLKLALTCDEHGQFYVQLGNAARHLAIQGLKGEAYIVPLRDGRVVRVDAETLKLNGGDFKIAPVYRHGTQHKPTMEPQLFGYSVAYKDGCVESYDFRCSDGKSESVALTSYTLPSGGRLDFAYDGFQLSKVTKGTVTLLEVEQRPAGIGNVPGTPFSIPKSIVVFPDSQNEKKTYRFTNPSGNSLQTTLEVDGFGAQGKVIYCLSRDSAGRLTGIAIEQQHPFTVDKKTETDRSLYSETLEYTSDNKVARHTLFPGGDMDALVHSYSYSNGSTTLVAFYKSAVPRTAFVRNYRLANGLSFVEHYGGQTMPTCKRRSHSLDTDKKTVVSETRIWEGDALVDQQSLTVDAVGNPVRRANGEEITYWTYYNNYQQFSVTETTTTVQDWSFFGCLFKGLDYVNVIGLGFAVGGSGGMTWGTRIDSTVDMSPALNDYAQKAFNLPVSISHCGSDRPFSGETESELVCRTLAGKEEPQRLTFFGWALVDGRIRARNRLTILQPDCIKVDVVEQQLKVAKDAAAPFITSLNAQIKAASDKEKPAYQKSLNDLNRSLEAQSKANGEGYKLQSWKAASMVLETYEYHTVKGQPGYGTVKSCETVQVQQSGALLESSRVKTSYEYSEDANEPHRLTIKTTVSRAGETAVTSSQTRSRLTGRLLESTDSEGNKVVRSYDPQGNLKSETVTRDGKVQRKTTCTLARKLIWQFDMVEDSNTTRIERDVLGRKIAEAVKPDGAASFLETWRWTYDALGRLASSVESDYGAGNARIAMRKSSRSYDALSGRITTTSVLQDGNGKDVKKISQEQTPSLRGERFVQGKFSMDRQYDVNKGTFTEQYSLAGSEGCRIERSLSAEGLMKSVRYLTVDTAKKATEQDRLDFEHDNYAQLTKVTPRLGGAIDYRHDSAGRLLSTTREGVVLANTYDANGLSSVASESKVIQGKVGQSLGTQRTDLLGRAIDRTIDANKTEFSYSGASSRATLKVVASAPQKPSDYSSSTAAQARTHDQKFAGKSSTLVFSTGGRVVSFTDLTGARTTYEYDFFNRLTGSTNEHCVCTWTYLDNGLLGKETVKAVKAGNLLMTVDYVYDGLGQEIKRTFTCSGMQTLGLERTLLGDGRLAKSVIMAADKPVYSDEYTYDKSLRLISWRSEYGRKDLEDQSRAASWSYDALGNLTDSLSALGQLTTSRQYDKNKPGQLLGRQVYHTNKGPQSALQTHSYTHDSAGRTCAMIDGLATENWSYHDNGQVKSLLKAQLNSPDTSEYTFCYDGEGRVRGGSIGTKADAYHYCGDRVYALVQTDSAKGDGFASRTLVLRNESRACLMQDADTDGRAGRSFELRDANGTVFASVDLVTKALTWFRYDPYGERYSGEKPENWLGFKGEPLNRLGLYHLGNGYRLYDPKLGCFLTRDSKSPFGIGGAGAYVFCNGDPVNNADPSGHEVIAQYSRWGAVPAIQSKAFRIVLGAVSVLLAPFTAGASMLLAVATTALSAIAFAFDVAAIIISQSDPQLAATLEAWGQAFGLASAAAGISISLQGIKGLPRNIFRSRGGPSFPRQAKLVKSPSELLIAQEARTTALNQLIQQADEARAAGTYDAFKASHLNADVGSVGGGLMPGMTLDTRFNQRGINGSKNLYKSIVNQFDDSTVDFLGKTLDMVAGPNTLIQKFIPPMVSETEIVSLVALPMPGRENLLT